MSEEETKELSKDELMMQELCNSLSGLQEQREKVRINLARATIALTDLNSLAMSTMEAIAEFERKGIKKVKVEKKDPADIPQAPNIPRGN